MSWSVLVPSIVRRRNFPSRRPAAGNGLRRHPEQQFGRSSAGRRLLKHAVSRTEDDVAAVRRPDRETSQRSLEREFLADAADEIRDPEVSGDSPETVAVRRVRGIGRKRQLLVRAGVADRAKRLAGPIEPRELLRRGLAPGAIRQPAIRGYGKRGVVVDRRHTIDWRGIATERQRLVVEWLDHQRLLADEEQEAGVAGRPADVRDAMLARQHRRRDRLLLRFFIERPGKDALNRTAPEVDEPALSGKKGWKARHTGATRRHGNRGSAAGRHPFDATCSAAAKEDRALGAPGAGPNRTARVTQDLRRSAGDGDLLQLTAETERDVPAVRRPDEALRPFRARQHAGVEARQVPDPEPDGPVRTNCREGQPRAIRREPHIGLEGRTREAASPGSASRRRPALPALAGWPRAGHPRCLLQRAAPRTSRPATHESIPASAHTLRLVTRRGGVSHRPVERVLDVPGRLPSLIRDPSPDTSARSDRCPSAFPDTARRSAAAGP